MPVNGQDLLEGIAILADSHNLRVTVKESSKGAAVCGAICFIGGILGGPVGLAVGGTIGGIAAYKITSNNPSKYPEWLMHCLLLCCCWVGGIFCGPIGLLIGLVIGGWIKKNWSQSK